MRYCVLTALVTLLLVAPARAQFGEAPKPKGSPLGPALSQKLELGMIVTAQGGPCYGLFGTASIPTDWPEQTVRVAKEDFSPHCKVDYRTIAGGVKQMCVSIPSLGAGEEAKAVLSLEIERHSLLVPPDTSIYVMPNVKKLPKDMRIYLGASPKIDIRNRKIVSLAKEIVTDKEGAWQKVQAIFDWIHENVAYEQERAAAPVRGALVALQDKKGDCEDISSLFIALCRASNIPARTVWIPGHAYAEFYLADKGGDGAWFPCDLAHNQPLGSNNEQRPVLQKGDNFRIPEKPREAKRYVSQLLTGKPEPGSGKPKVKFIRPDVFEIEEN